MADRQVAICIGLAFLAAVVVVAMFGVGHLGYDEIYALQWGSSLRTGSSPEFGQLLAPTPHPLTIWLGTIVSALGAETAATAFGLIGALMFVYMAVAAARLGVNLGLPIVGLIFALLLVSRPIFAGAVARGSTDIWFAALVLQATVLLTGRRTRVNAALIVLMLAGLIRPEAWLLAGGVVIYYWRELEGKQRLNAVMLAASAPVLWLLTDLLLTGKPFYSLTATQANAVDLQRPRGLLTALELLPVYLRTVVTDWVFWVGLLGIAVAIIKPPRKIIVPTLFGVVGVLTFIALGVFDLPLIVRYLTVPAVVLVLYTAVAVCAPLLGSEGSKVPMYLVSLGAVSMLVASIPQTVTQFETTEQFSSRVNRQQDGLFALAEKPAVRAAAKRCKQLYVPNFRVRPLAALIFDQPVSTTISAQTQRPTAGLLLTPNYASGDPGPQLDTTEPNTTPIVVPAGFKFIATNDSWQAFVKCPVA